MQMPWQETPGLQHHSERVQMAGLKLYANPPQGAVAPWSEAHVTLAASAAATISDDVSTPLVVARSHTSPLPAHVAVQLSPCAPLNQPGGDGCSSWFTVHSIPWASRRRSRSGGSASSRSRRAAGGDGDGATGGDGMFEASAPQPFR